MRYQINNGALNELSDTPINPSSEEIDNFDNGVMWYEDNNGSLYNYLKINNTNMLLNKVYLPYLKFSSDSTFTLSVSNPGSNPGWDGTIEYSLDKGNTWSTWNGSQLSGNENNPIYLRGIGNTIVLEAEPWTFTGKYITGNIETLLDYQTVVNGQHPAMGDYCYAYMFQSCTSLVTAPELPTIALIRGCYESMFAGCTSLTTPPKLPATTLAGYCYQNMFAGCTSLTTAPKLSATTLVGGCYNNMFHGCTSLTTPPKLPATILASYCYQNMFSNCTSLTTVPKLPATTLASYCYMHMFNGCASLKLSETQDSNVYKYPYRIPTSGTGTDATAAMTSMFSNTGGTFTGIPTINTTYYTDHQPV